MIMYKMPESYDTVAQVNKSLEQLKAFTDQMPKYMYTL